MLLLRLSLNHIKRFKLQSLLMVLGIALGVAVVVSIDLASQSARQSFQASTRNLAGQATHQIIGSHHGLPEKIYTDIKVQSGFDKISPIVEGFGEIEGLKNISFRLLGLDPFAEGAFRGYIKGQAMSYNALAKWFALKGAVFISHDLAQKQAWKIGQQISFQHQNKQQLLTIVGFLSPSQNAAKEVLQTTLLTDISSAQEILNKEGFLTRIDLKLEHSQDLSTIQSLLPPALKLQKLEDRMNAVGDMSRAFELNLLSMSLLAILVGIFLIYNTISFSIVRRRTVLGNLRALGATREQIFQLIVGETLVLGLIGSIAGLGLGILLGQGTVRLVAQTIRDHYYDVAVSGLYLAPGGFIKGFLTGMIASFIAALIPAWQATKIPPSGVIQRSRFEETHRQALPLLNLAGSICLGIGAILSFTPDLGLIWGFISFFLIAFGFSFLVPGFTLILMSLIQFITSVTGLTGRMAPQNISRSLSRTGMAIAALMMTVSVIVSVSIMVGSFRTTVANWLEDTLGVDLYISVNGDFTTSMEPEVKDKLKHIQGIKQLTSSRQIRLETQKYGQVFLLAISHDSARKRLFFWSEGSQKEIWKQLQQGAVMVSEPFANRHHLSHQSGQHIQLLTDQGLKSFPVVAIYQDYASEHGRITMAETIYRRYWTDKKLSSLGLLLDDSQDSESIRQHIHQILPPNIYHVQSQANLREGALEVFDRTFAITGALRLLAAIVAFIGIFSTLMALILERFREIGILRANGMTAGQLFRLLSLETGLLGLAAGLMAIPVGWILSLVLTYVINKQSFGWTIIYSIEPIYFLQALALSIGSALLAGLYPIWRSSQIRPVDALRME